MVLDILFNDISYWAYFGTMYLCLLTYQDYKNNMRIDDRKNYFMMGITVSLISYTKPGLLYLISLTVIVGVLFYYWNKYKVMGDGDLTALNWIFFGFGLISPGFLIFYFITFAAATLFYIFLKSIVLKWFIKKVLKSSYDSLQPLPFFGVILITFIFSCAIYGLY